MTLDQAKELVAKSNPLAVFIEYPDCKGAFQILDFTYSDEVRAVIGAFDDCCVGEELTDIDGNVWIDRVSDEAFATVPPAPTIPAVPSNGWSSVTWNKTHTQVFCIGRPACKNMPDYVSIQFGTNALNASACLTPADARKVAAMLLQATDKAEGK